MADNKKNPPPPSDFRIFAPNAFAPQGVQTYSSTEAFQKATDKPAKPPKPKPPSGVSQLASDAATLLSPYQSVLDNLPSQYANAVSGFNQSMQSAPTGGSPGLDQAIGQAQQAAMAGEAGIQKALGGEAQAGKTLAADLPYSDVLASSLVGQKNRLLYGSTNLGHVDTSQAHWPSALTNIYNYINGTVAGGAPGGAIPGGIGQLPSLQQAASGNFGTGGSVPAPGGAGAGQA